MRAAFFTLGCKVNQYETQVMAQQFAAAGFETVPWPGPAEVFVVNSCTVTAQSEKKAAQLLRRLQRLHPEALLVLCGCWPQVFPAEAAATGAHVVAGTARAGLAGLVQQALHTGRQVVAVSPHPAKEGFEPMQATAMEGHTRAFIKIEDGCDRFCSYCIIPHARGRVRSKPLQALKSEARFLAEKGFCEIVLTGINLSGYGKGEDFGLLDAVKTVAAVKGIQRVRLGSLEPDLTDPALLQGLAQTEKFCPQFHLSVQSGCNATLQRMNRRYTAEEYLDLCRRIRSLFPEAAITTDLMVGFAGETEEEFEQTLAFLKEAAFAQVHVFPYSRRPGTPACTMQGQVEEGKKAHRARQAALLAELSRQRFLRGMEGSVQPVLFERCPLPGKGRGHTPNGTLVVVDSAKDLRGSILPVRITGADPEGQHCLGSLLEEV